MLKGLFLVVVTVFMIANIIKIVLDVHAVRKTKTMFKSLNRKDN